MMSADRDALVCDFAETYGIYNLRALPVSLLATLAVGLRENSRIKMRISSEKLPKNELFLAAIVDRLSLLVWAKTQDGQKGINRPASVLDLLVGGEHDNGDVEAFESADDFEGEWERITGVKHG